MVMIGEIGARTAAGADSWKENQEAGRGFIAGQTAPPGRRMGHAGAIISGSSGTAREDGRAGEGPASSVPADVVPLLRSA